MKQYIRTNTFETNSSSMHSLVVVKDPKPYSEDETLMRGYHDNTKSFDLFWHEDGTYERYPFQVLREPIDKLRYYVAHYIGAFNKKGMIRKVKRFISKETGVAESKVEIRSYDDYKDKRSGYGWAGLNDTGEDVFDYIERNKISMQDFVLNPKYVVIVDGDEYQEFKKLFESNIIDTSKFEYISSGAEYWDDSNIKLSLCWLLYGSKEYKLDDVLKDINKFVKKITFEVTDADCIAGYNKVFKKIRKFVEAVRKTEYPIDIYIECTQQLEAELRTKDISIFDYLTVLNHEYGSVIATYTLK